MQDPEANDSHMCGDLPADCDVAIAGSGPAGAALARELAEAGCRVVLLERSHFDQPRIGESLAPNVQPLLARLGLWSSFLGLDPLPSYGTRSVWGGPVAQDHSHLATPYLHGWHVNRMAFDRMLAMSAQCSGARLLLDSKVTDCKACGNDGFVLQVARKDGMSALRARFLVDAGGRHPASSRWLGAHRIVFDRLVGVAAQFSHGQAAMRCYTLVEAVPDGWWYSAPVAPGCFVTMLMTDGDLASRRQLADWLCWRQALDGTWLTQAHLEGAELRWGPRIFSALSQRMMKDAEDERPWLAVGDAALSVDPISGSGVIRALRSAEAAATTIMAVLDGKISAMKDYEAGVNEACIRYLRERSAYYRMEERWPGSVFWQRRAVELEQCLPEIMG